MVTKRFLRRRAGGKPKRAVVARATPEMWPEIKDDVIRLEERLTGQRFTPTEIEEIFRNPECMCFVVFKPDPAREEGGRQRGRRVVAMAYGGPLETFSYLAGLPKDPHFGQHNTLYGAGLVVDEDEQPRSGYASLLIDHWIDTQKKQYTGGGPHRYMTFRTNARSLIYDAMRRRGATFKTLGDTFELSDEKITYGTLDLETKNK